MNPIWRIELLGGLRATRDAQIITRFETRKSAALLALLALKMENGCPRERLADQLWPEEDTESTRDRFRQALAAVRRALEPPDTPAGSVLIADRLEIRLNPATCESDALEFERTLRAASRVSEAGPRAELLLQALSLYRGDLLPGYYEAWILAERNRLSELHCNALVDAAVALAESGARAEALEFGRRAVAADPLREEAHCLLMRLYADSGRAGDALKQYREMERLLRQDLDIAPSSAARELLEHLRSQPNPSALPNPSASPPCLPYKGRGDSDLCSPPLQGLEPEGGVTPLSFTRRGAGGEVVRAGGEVLQGLEPEGGVTPLSFTRRGAGGEVVRAGGEVVQGLEPEGGAVPLDSAFYIVRRTDEEFEDAVARCNSIVLVKGARQMGKTSLLARGLERARNAGARIVLTDLQKLTASQLESADSLFRTFAEIIADQLDLDIALNTFWKPERGWNVNFERFLRREVLGRLDAPLVWGLDEVDRLFGYPFSTEVFGLFRSWHNERSLDPSGPWRRLTLAIAYATEAHLFITDLNQSPFNVGVRLALEDFTVAEVAELNRRYNSPLADSGEIERYCALVGGNPYLARRGLNAMATQGLPIAEFEAEAARDNGIFGDHLGRALAALRQDADLCDAVRAILRARPCPSPESFYRLRSAGIVSGESPARAQFRCGLYHAYLERRLL